MTDRRELLAVEGGAVWMDGKKIGRLAEVKPGLPVYTEASPAREVIVSVHITDPEAFQRIAEGHVPALSVGATTALPRSQVGRYPPRVRS